MPVLTAPAKPKSRAAIERLTKEGLLDIKGAMAFLQKGKTAVWKLVTNGELWSFDNGFKRVIPVVELRRWQAADIARTLAKRA